LANAQILPAPETYELLDIQYIASDLDGNVIKNTAKLVRKLSDGQKNQIRIASEKQKMTELFEELYKRIKMDNPAMAEELKDKTLAGNYDETFIQHIRYEVKPDEANDYITVGADQMEVYLNDNAVGTDQSLMTRTLAHELKHLEYAFLHPYIKLKWMILRNKNPNKLDYELGDELGLNGHCSAGAGHEMYNPENEEVCDEEKKY